MEDLINQRLREFLKAQGITQKEFCEAIDMPLATLKTAFQRDSSLSADTIAKATIEYPNLNVKWLLTGKGEKITRQEMLRVHNPPYPESINENVVVPLYNIEAAANLTMVMENEKENVIAYISLPNMPTVDGAVAVRGDSMYPIIKSGDIIVFKWVSSPEYITFGEIYLVSYTWDNDVHVTVKYVKRSETPEYVKLVSYNTHHEPLDIPIASIQSIALVKVSIRYNTIS